MLKPYETIRFSNFSTFYLPSALYIFYLIRYFNIYQFSMLEGLVFMPWRLLGYFLLWICYQVFKGYVVFKVNKLDQEERQK